MKLGFHLNRVVTMNQTLFGALALATALTVGACQSHAGKPLPDAAVISFEQQQEGGFRTQWQWALGLNKDEKITNLWRVGDSLYVYTSQEQLHSFAAATGTKNWTLDLGPNNIKIFSPAEIGDGSTLMIVSRSDMYYVDKRTGTISRRAQLAESATNQPVATGLNLVYGSAGAIFGTYLDSPSTRDWSVRATDDSFMAPLLKVDESNVIAVTYSGYVWSLNGGNGVANWPLRKVNGTVVAKPAVSADKKLLVIVAGDKKAYAFNNNNGNEMWDARLDGELTRQPVIAAGMVLAVGDGKGLYALDATTGLEKWFTKGVTQVLSAGESEIIAADKHGSLVRINPADGTITAFSRVKDADRFLAANTDGDLIFLATKDGRIAAVARAK